MYIEYITKNHGRNYTDNNEQGNANIIKQISNTNKSTRGSK